MKTVLLGRRKMTGILDYTSSSGSAVYANRIYRNHHTIHLTEALIKTCGSLRSHFINSSLQEDYV